MIASIEKKNDNILKNTDLILQDKLTSWVDTTSKVYDSFDSLSEPAQGKLKVLLIEDSENDMMLLTRELKKGEYLVDISWIQSIEELKTAIEESSFDLVISDFSMPEFNGFDVLNLIKKNSTEVPFILVSGKIGDDGAVQLMKQGANDYIMKDQLIKLVPAIERELKEWSIRKEHKKAVEALDRSEIKFRQVFENIRDIYFKTDLKGRVLEVSPSVKKYANFSHQEFIGKSIVDLCYYPIEKEKIINEILRKSELKDIEFKSKKNGSPIKILSMNSHTIKDKSGTPVYIEGSLRDITEIRYTEYELTKALEKADEGRRLKSAFLQNISHEIRTPLNSIIGFLELLKDNANNREEVIEYTDIIKQSGRRLIEVVNNILEISKIQTGQIEIYSKQFSINTLITDLYSFFLPLANEKGLILNYYNYTNDENSLIYSDYTKLYQVFSYLLDNAVKFTNKGEIEYGYELKGDKIKFYVKDTGIGIHPKFHEKIFRSFSQVDFSISREYEGSGLGLAISKGYVEFLGGRIWLESDVHIGSTFNFTIPYISVTLDNLTNIEISKNILNNKIIKVLIAEDDYICYKYLTLVLHGDKYKVKRARNGKEAVQLVKDSPDFDIVLMDLMMPVMDGLEATRQIKKIRPDLPVIAQTADIFEDEIGLIHSAGCENYIVKPIDKDKLLNMIEIILK